MARRSSSPHKVSVPGSKKSSSKISPQANEAPTPGGAPAEEETWPEGPETVRWVSSYEALGKIFGLHRVSFSRLTARLKAIGVPFPTPRANGDHDVEAWRAFFDEHPDIRRQAEEGKGAALDESIKEEKLRGLKFKNDVEDGLYLLKAEVEEWVRNKVQQLRDKLSAKLKQELPAKLEGLRAVEIASKMDRVISDLCAVLQRDRPKPAKKARAKKK